jgi:hypothetical protein
MHRLVTIAMPSLPPARYLVARITGAVEASLAPARAGEATRLLGLLLRAEDGGTVDLGTLAAPVHDRLLADIYTTEIGERADCRAQCAACGEAFEFGFALAGLIAAQDEAARGIGLPDVDGCWPAGEARLRVPLLRDLADPSPAALLARLCAPAPHADAAEALAAILEQAAPLLSLDLDALCPHCGAAQRLPFDLPRFLLAALANERPFLVRETHLVAARYGWSHAEIMALPRDERRAYASLIESERSAALRQRRPA